MWTPPPRLEPESENLGEMETVISLVPTPALHPESETQQTVICKGVPDPGAVASAARLRPEDPLLGEVIEQRYLLEHCIAHSAMSRVYRARQLRLQRLVAVKVLAAEGPGAPSASYRRRFAQEAAVLARLSHPNVVRVIDHGEHEGHPFLVMEYLTGETLLRRCRNRGVTPVEAIEVVDRVARALSAAHAAGLVHRDVKPSNIFVSGSFPNTLDVRLVDFGVAKDLNTDRALTVVHSLIGTPSYMSPEQILCEPVDARSDVYALGMVLFRLLAGRTPHAHLRGAPLLVAHLQSALPRLGDIRPNHGLPPLLEWTIRRCLEKAPAHRFADMDELRLALDACRHALRDPDNAPTLDLRDGRVVRVEDSDTSAGGRLRLPWWAWAMPVTLSLAVLGTGAVQRWMPVEPPTAVVDVAAPANLGPSAPILRTAPPTPVVPEVQPLSPAPRPHMDVAALTVPEPMPTVEEPPVSVAVPPTPAAPGQLRELAVRDRADRLEVEGALASSAAGAVGYLIEEGGRARYVIELPHTDNGTGLARFPVTSALASDVSIQARGDHLDIIVSSQDTGWVLPEFQPTARGFLLVIQAAGRP